MNSFVVHISENHDYDDSYVEDKPSKVMDFERRDGKKIAKIDGKEVSPPKSEKKYDTIDPEKAVAEVQEVSPFEFDTKKGYIVNGEDPTVLAKFLGPEEMAAVMANAKKIETGDEVARFAKHGPQEVETISEDSVERFDNI